MEEIINSSSTASFRLGLKKNTCLEVCSMYKMWQKTLLKRNKIMHSMYSTNVNLFFCFKVLNNPTIMLPGSIIITSFILQMSTRLINEQMSTRYGCGEWGLWGRWQSHSFFTLDWRNVSLDLACSNTYRQARKRQRFKIYLYNSACSSAFLLQNMEIAFP